MTAPLLSVTVPSKLAPYCACANAVNATMLTISSATWTAKLGRLMESPRIERVLLVQCKLRDLANRGPTRLLNLWKSDLVNNRRMLIARLNLSGQALNATHTIWRKGWRTVVKAGFWKAALWMSSNPTTETSSGTCRPASRKARIAPMAEISLKEKSAVKAAPEANNILVAMYPS